MLGLGSASGVLALVFLLTILGQQQTFFWLYKSWAHLYSAGTKVKVIIFNEI